MAQLDLSVLQFFLPIFTFLLIFGIIYAVLSKFKLMGESTGLKWIVALSISLVFLFSGKAVTFVKELVPWFVILFILIFLIFAVFMFMGAKMENVPNDPAIMWIILTFIIIALLITIGKVFGPIGEIESDTPEDQAKSDFLKTIFSAKVLGALVLLFISLFAVQNLSKEG